MRVFPDTFLWGGVVSAHPTEGEDVLADWWHWEQRPKRIADASTSQMAAGHRQRYREDFALARKLGHNSVLLCLSWPRVHVGPDAFDAAALAHYQSVFRSAKEQGLTPLCALQHVTLPAWLGERGGWTCPEAPALFAVYAGAVAGALCDLCETFYPLYEPLEPLRRSGLERQWPGPATWGAFRQSVAQVQEAQRLAAVSIRAAAPGAAVGLSLRADCYVPDDPGSVWDWRAARRIYQWLNSFVEQCPDFDVLGLSCHGTVPVRFRVWGPPPLFAQTDSGRLCPDAQGFAAVLREVCGLEKPVHILGNGVAAGNDADRVQYLMEHLELVQTQVAEGGNIHGYFHYALLDGWEWTRGFSDRYGLIHVDQPSLTRTPNTSAFCLRDIIEARAITPAVKSKYLAPLGQGQ